MAKKVKHNFDKPPYRIPYDMPISGTYKIESKVINTKVRIYSFSPNTADTHSFYQPLEGKNELVGSIEVKNTAIKRMSKGETVMAKIKGGIAVKLTKEKR